MKRVILASILLSCGVSTVYAAAPSRDNTYIAGTVISPTSVMANENTIYTYLQNGVDTYATNSIPTGAIQDSAVTSAKIQDATITTADLAFSITQGNILPSGAVFFMVTGSCPAWTTDVSVTYSNLFVRINATQGTLAGSDTHTHTAGTYVGPSHTHTVPYSGWTGQNINGSNGQIVGWTITTLAAFTADNATGSGGSGAITGTSTASSNVPSYLSAKLCQVN